MHRNHSWIFWICSTRIFVSYASGDGKCEFLKLLIQITTYGSWSLFYFQVCNVTSNCSNLKQDNNHWQTVFKQEQQFRQELQQKYSELHSERGKKNLLLPEHCSLPWIIFESFSAWKTRQKHQKLIIALSREGYYIKKAMSAEELDLWYLTSMQLCI